MLKSVALPENLIDRDYNFYYHLINEAEVSEYIVHPSPIRSPIFDAGKTSRINVADFMVSLLKDAELWGNWKYKTPVIYNIESNK